MKRFLYFIFLVYNFSTGQELFDKISVDICNCFEENEDLNRKNFDIKFFDICHDLSMKKYKPELELLLYKDVDSTSSEYTYEHVNKLGYELGKRMFNKILEPMINNCDAYYTYFSKAREIMLINLGKGITEQKVDSLTNLIEKSYWKTNLLFQRGAYELGLGNVSKAKSDLVSCLEKNPIHIHAMFFLAMAHELEEDYKSAIPLYEEIIDQNQNQNPLTNLAKIYLTITKRRLKENK
ncbi:hypothetical protein [Aquimarina sp. 2304DJ70-9]|uniref:hypothetical protein n=1 Tax=Aquimarina penaris TaxID=3231044 RepID=UPI003462291B